MNKLGFSLIELMVVIAIVGLLTAIAVPSYKAYSLQTVWANVMPLVRAQLDGVIIQYEKNGSWPDPATFGPYSIPNGGYEHYANFGPIASENGNDSNLYYAIIYDVSNTKPNGIVFRMPIAGLSAYGIPNYTSLGNHFTVGLQHNSNNTYTFVCGGLIGDQQDIPYQYLPAECSCTSVQNYIIGLGC